MDHPATLCRDLPNGALAYAHVGGAWLVRSEDGALAAGGAWDGRLRLRAERALRLLLAEGLPRQVLAHWWRLGSAEHMLLLVDCPDGILLLRTEAALHQDAVSGIIVPHQPRIVIAREHGRDLDGAAEHFARLRCALGTLHP